MGEESACNPRHDSGDSEDEELTAYRANSHGTGNDFRLPDFTVSYEGDTFYWEHLGMLSVPSYKEAWDRKRQWYEDNGFLDRVITSEDGLDGSIDAAEIERIARKKILLEG